PPDLKDRMKTTYDAIAHTYNAVLGTVLDPIRLDYLNRLLVLLKASSSDTINVLELGCGAGLPVTKTLLEHTDPTIHVTANDLSPVQLDLARKNLSPYVETGKLKLIEGDMTTLSFPPASFTAVLGFYSIIHLPRDEQTVLLKKIGTWLKPGGYLLANFAAEEREVAVQERWLGEERGWAFWSAWDAEGSVGMVEGAGLEVLVREVRDWKGDASFLWVIGKK
ncbi:methyltransferase, partial [Bimuria novae-zelandiae CBS 107.79]